MCVVRDMDLTSALLFQDKPLFFPLGRAENGACRPLRVVIFGADTFAMELFQTVFWLGQLLDVRLCITVVCPPGTGAAFQAALTRRCPELIPSCTVDSDCLRIRPHGSDFSPPYASLSFLEEDVAVESLRAFLDRGGRTYFCGDAEPYRLADCDYYLISGGNDTQNITLAGELCNALVYLQSKTGRAGRGGQIIAPFVQSVILSDIAKNRFENDQGVQRDIYGIAPPEIYPFGNLKSRFCYERIFTSGGDLALANASSKERQAEHGFAEDISKVREDDIYSSWASIGRDYHMISKMYCAGCYVPGNGPEGSPSKEADRFKEMIRDADSPMSLRLKWLEHRRWNAFLRALGFTLPPISLDDLDATFRPIMPALSQAKTNRDAWELLQNNVVIAPSLQKEGTKLLSICGLKNVPTKLHPCLVEAAPETSSDPDHYDYLDLINAARIYIDLQKKYNDPDKYYKEFCEPRLSAEERRKAETLPFWEETPSNIKKYDSPDSDKV